MKKCTFLGIAGALLALSLSWGETITASSNPFSFPPFVGIRDGQSADHLSYFSFSKASLKSNKVIFSWAMPMLQKNEFGTISIYSLLGRKVKTFTLTSRAGSLVWQMNPSEKMAGVYIARFAFGSYKHNLKLILSK
jgi:hypothetical protein